MDENELGRIHTNQRLVVLELQRRGVGVELLDPDLELLEARLGDHVELLLDRDSSITPYHVSVLAGDKAVAKRLLSRAGLHVPEGESFGPDETERALAYAQELGYPLVVKPVSGSHGDGVHTDLRSLPHVLHAIQGYPGRRYIIEQQAEGEEYRIFITNDGRYAALHRDAAHVIGDGVHTIEELAVAETYRRTHPRHDSLCPIVLDDEVARYLTQHNRSLANIPAAGEKTRLRRISNVAKGGVSEDVTGRVHPTFIDACRRALAAFPGMPYAGIDVITADIATPGPYAILEVNSVPGVHMHMSPGKGASQDVARIIADLIFPETRR